MRLPVFFQAPKAVEKFQQRVKKKLVIYHGRCPSGFRPLPNPLRFGFPGLDPWRDAAGSIWKYPDGMRGFYPRIPYILEIRYSGDCNTLKAQGVKVCLQAVSKCLVNEIGWRLFHSADTWKSELYRWKTTELLHVINWKCRSYQRSDVTQDLYIRDSSGCWFSGFIFCPKKGIYIATTKGWQSRKAAR